MRDSFCGFRVGDRIRMVHCADPFPVTSRQKGTVDFIDDLGTLHVTWDNGRCLGVCLEEDIVEKISPIDELRSVDGVSAMDCEGDAFDAHALRVSGAISEMEREAVESGGSWVVRRSYSDPGNEGRDPEYFYVRAGGLWSMLDGADGKNGVDAGFLHERRRTAFALISYGQGYSSPKGSGFVTEVFECRMLSASATADFEERLEAGWSEWGDGPRKMYFSLDDQRSLQRSASEFSRALRSARGQDDMSL